jgi:hypothetical protein
MTNYSDGDIPRRGLVARGSWSTNPVAIIAIILAVIIVGWVIYSFSGARMTTAPSAPQTTTAPAIPAPDAPSKTTP